MPHFTLPLFSVIPGFLKLTILARQKGVEPSTFGLEVRVVDEAHELENGTSRYGEKYVKNLPYYNEKFKKSLEVCKKERCCGLVKELPINANLKIKGPN
ncbi:MAG: hypothetical protein LBC11_03340 [Puniceicoccales bacterium]|jgi:hypothetical protein|nr:hypothetical protein [Puniceicoccales bacterium]